MTVRLCSARQSGQSVYATAVSVSGKRRIYKHMTLHRHGAKQCNVLFIAYQTNSNERSKRIRSLRLLAGAFFFLPLFLILFSFLSFLKLYWRLLRMLSECVYILILQMSAQSYGQ